MTGSGSAGGKALRTEPFTRPMRTSERYTTSDMNSPSSILGQTLSEWSPLLPPTQPERTASRPQDATPEYAMLPDFGQCSSSTLVPTNPASSPAAAPVMRGERTTPRRSTSQKGPAARNPRGDPAWIQVHAFRQ